MKAIDCFEAAIELDPELAEAHIAMAYVTMYYGSSWTDAEEHWIRALELDPEFSLAHSQFTLFLAAFGREGEVREHGSIASRLDPLEPFVPAITGTALFIPESMEEARQWAVTSLDLQPDYPLALLTLGLANSYLGEHERAIEALEETVRLTNRASIYLGLLGLAYGRAGDRQRAEALLLELQARAVDE